MVHIFMIVWVLTMGVLLYVMWRYLLYITHSGNATLFFPCEEQSQDFKNNSFSNFLLLLSAVIIIVAGVVSIITDFKGFLHFIFAVIFVIYYDWRQKFPYIRITHDKIIFFKTLVYGPHIINKNFIKEVDVETWTDFPYKVNILLSNNKKIGIHLYSIHEEDRKRLYHALTELRP